MAKSSLPAFLYSFATVLIMAALLSACTPLLDAGMGKKQSRALTESSYAAADMLIQQSRSVFSPETPLEIGTLTDLDSPNERTNFGRMVAEQIASRFVQLGYNVTAAPEMTAPQSLQSPGVPAYDPGRAAGRSGAPARAIITGRYAVARDAVLVNLRLVEAGSGKVIAAYDYNVPKTPDVRELAKTRAEKESLFDF